MNFLGKLDYLMREKNLNKSTLSKACDIPYTTIDGWYKKGYEGLKLTTLRKLAAYFETSLDFWANDDLEPPFDLDSCQQNQSQNNGLINIDPVIGSHHADLFIISSIGDLLCQAPPESQAAALRILRALLDEDTDKTDK